MSDRDCIEILTGKAIRSGSVIIDAGAGSGAWTSAALAAVPGIEVHCFEPDPAKYRQLLLNLAAAIASGQVVPHNATVGWEQVGSGVAWASLAQYAAHAKLNRLPFVRLGPGIPVSAGTVGCENLIRHGHVEFILATADVEQETALGSVLLPHRYEMFRHPAMGDQVLCASDRFRSTIKNEPAQMPDVLQLCREFEIIPKGVVHIGAHEGHEAKKYATGGIKKTLMVEANPAVYERLQSNVAGLAGVVTVNCAASDQNGMIELRVTNADQSSSILPLARHSAIYPSVRQTSVVQVATKTIDQILKEVGHDAGDYNLMNIDIQGAELMALKGAVELLPNVQAILVEVNYDELYAGCPMIEEIDAFLESHGFDRVATTTPFHASWGDAFTFGVGQASISPKAVQQFLHEARNTLVNGWLNIPAASLREAWEGATGRAHRHLIENGVHQLPLAAEDDHRVFQLLQDGLKSATKDRRLNLQLATMLYAPLDRISTQGMPSWLKNSLPRCQRTQAA